jgi:hypothetical protein
MIYKKILTDELNADQVEKLKPLITSLLIPNF